MLSSWELSTSLYLVSLWIRGEGMADVALLSRRLSFLPTVVVTAGEMPASPDNLNSFSYTK